MKTLILSFLATFAAAISNGQTVGVNSMATLSWFAENGSTLAPHYGPTATYNLPTSSCFDGAKTWVANNFSGFNVAAQLIGFAQNNPSSTTTITLPTPPPGNESYVSSVACDPLGSNMVFALDQEMGRVYVVNTQTGSVTLTFPVTLESGAYYIAWNGSTIWVAETFSNQVSGYSPTTGDRTYVIPVNDGTHNYQPQEIMVDNNGQIWVTTGGGTFGNYLIALIAPSASYPTGAFRAKVAITNVEGVATTSVRGITYDGISVYVGGSNSSGNTVAKVNAQTLAMTPFVDVNPTPVNVIPVLTWTGSALWVMATAMAPELREFDAMGNALTTMTLNVAYYGSPVGMSYSGTQLMVEMSEGESGYGAVARIF